MAYCLSGRAVLALGFLSGKRMPTEALKITFHYAKPITMRVYSESSTVHQGTDWWTTDSPIYPSTASASAFQHFLLSFCRNYEKYSLVHQVVDDPMQFKLEQARFRQTLRHANWASYVESEYEVKNLHYTPVIQFAVIDDGKYKKAVPLNVVSFQEGEYAELDEKVRGILGKTVQSLNDSFTPPASYVSLASHALHRLFADYSKPRGGLFFSGHWNRHHQEAASALISQLQQTESSSQQFLLLSNELHRLETVEANLSGSYARRLRFGLSALSVELAKPLLRPSAPSLP